MTLLVAGNAAVLDLILRTDELPADTAVGVLAPTPGASGKWLPGGAAFTIALSARQQGVPVALWHPLPSDEAADPVIAGLRRAGIDLSRAPRLKAESGRCVLMSIGDRRAAWSTPGVSPADADFERMLSGISHVVIASRWSDWTEHLLSAARAHDIPISIVGETSARLAHFQWTYVVLDESQLAQVGHLTAEAIIATRGSAGAILKVGDTRCSIAAVEIHAVDTTGAGDAFGGTFIARRLKGDDYETAARIASRVAAKTCEAWGSWAGFSELPSHDGTVAQEHRVRGALAGTACGDAFGMPNSFLSDPPWRTEMMPGPPESPYHAGYPAGRITDDTEQALALTDALEDGLTPAAVARRLNDWFVSVGGEASLAVGPSTKRAMLAYQAKVAVTEIGRTGVTNGAAMRISPIGVYAGLRAMSLEALVDTVEVACLPTHHTAPAISGAAAIAAAIAAGIQGSNWKEMMSYAVEGARAGARRGAWIYSADVAERILHALELASKQRTDRDLVKVISNVVGAGEPSTESVPAALAIAHYAGGDPARAIELSGNLRGDTDTVAAMAGAVCGAYAGDRSLPTPWLEIVSHVNSLDFERWADRLARCARAAVERR
jgi:ADP-ribosylglycohydrolase/sugar/nucleoside kinase (ribokinase family)